jgi:DNA repair/transcription protein MET18/MMS19
MFHPTDPSTEAAALNALKVLVKTILTNCDKLEDDRGEMTVLVDVACNDCVHALREPEKSQAKLAIKVICAFSSTTSPLLLCYGSLF